MSIIISGVENRCFFFSVNVFHSLKLESIWILVCRHLTVIEVALSIYIIFFRRVTLSFIHYWYICTSKSDVEILSFYIRCILVLCWCLFNCSSFIVLFYIKFRLEIAVVILRLKYCNELHVLYYIFMYFSVLTCLAIYLSLFLAHSVVILVVFLTLSYKRAVWLLL